MTEETHLKLKDIKQNFRLLMNGETTKSMREKGVDYHLNWGANILDLRKTTMIMPPKEMPAEIVELWMEQTPSLEIAEQAAYNLFQHLDYASVLAFQWIASEKEFEQVCGFHVLSRLFMKGMEPDERGINEVIDQILTAIQGESFSVKHAAISCVRRFAELGDAYEQIARSSMKSIDLDLY